MDINIRQFLVITHSPLPDKMAILSTGGTSSPDIILTTILSLCCIISTLLNLLVLHHNFAKPHTIQRVMFRILATVDLVLCLLIAPYVAHNTSRVDVCNYASGGGENEDSDTDSGKGDSVKNKGVNDESSSDKGGDKAVKAGIATDPESFHFRFCFVNNPSPALRIYGNITAILIVLPAILWAALTVVRLIQIRYPLKHIGKKKMFTTVAGFVLMQIILNVVILNSARPDSTTVPSMVVWIGSTQQIMVFSAFGYDWPKLTVSVILYAVPILYQFIGLVACVLTIVTLMENKEVNRGTQSKRNYTKITLKILLGNSCSFIYLVYVCMVAFPSATSYYTQGTGEYSYSNEYSYSVKNLLASCVVPCFLAALNPIIFILLTPNSLALGKLRIWKKTSSKRSTQVTNLSAMSAK